MTTATPTKTTSTRTKKPVSIQPNELPNGNLRLQYSARLRLDDDQRRQILNAYDQLNAQLCGNQTSRTGDIVATHSNTSPNLVKQLGMDRMTLTSLVASRESLPIGIVRRFERVLGVSLITEEFLRSCFDTYLAHVLRENEDE
jgi:hypothetical protein